MEVGVEWVEDGGQNMEMKSRIFGGLETHPMWMNLKNLIVKNS